jgi:hypothetical protein
MRPQVAGLFAIGPSTRSSERSRKGRLLAGGHDALPGPHVPCETLTVTLLHRLAAHATFLAAAREQIGPDRSPDTDPAEGATYDATRLS